MRQSQLCCTYVGEVWAGPKPCTLQVAEGRAEVMLGGVGGIEGWLEESDSLPRALPRKGVGPSMQPQTLPERAGELSAAPAMRTWQRFRPRFGAWGGAFINSTQLCCTYDGEVWAGPKPCTLQVAEGRAEVKLGGVGGIEGWLEESDSLTRALPKEGGRPLHAATDSAGASRRTFSRACNAHVAKVPSSLRGLGRGFYQRAEADALTGCPPLPTEIWQ